MVYLTTERVHELGRLHPIPSLERVREWVALYDNWQRLSSLNADRSQMMIPGLFEVVDNPIMLKGWILENSDEQPLVLAQLFVDITLDDDSTWGWALMFVAEVLMADPRVNHLEGDLLEAAEKEFRKNRLRLTRFRELYAAFLSGRKSLSLATVGRMADPLDPIAVHNIEDVRSVVAAYDDWVNIAAYNLDFETHKISTWIKNLFPLLIEHEETDVLEKIILEGHKIPVPLNRNIPSHLFLLLFMDHVDEMLAADVVWVPRFLAERVLPRMRLQQRVVDRIEGFVRTLEPVSLPKAQLDVFLAAKERNVVPLGFLEKDNVQRIEWIERKIEEGLIDKVLGLSEDDEGSFDWNSAPTQHLLEEGRFDLLNKLVPTPGRKEGWVAEQMLEVYREIVMPNKPRMQHDRARSWFVHRVVPRLGEYMSHDSLVEIDEWVHNTADEGPWKESRAYLRVADYLVAEEYTKRFVANDYPLRVALRKHVYENQRYPDFVRMINDAPRTTRTNFYWRGINTDEFGRDVLFPISVSWDFHVAEKFTREIGVSDEEQEPGLIMVIRVAPGTPIIAVVPHATYITISGYETELITDEGYIENEVILPSFGRLEDAADPNAFIAEWYQYRFKSDVFHEARMDHKLVLLDFVFEEPGLPKRLLERDWASERVLNYDPADTRSRARRRRRPPTR